MNNAKNLTEGPIAKSIILFALPLLLSNLFQQLYNAVDSAVVGHYAGSAALAAVGSTASVINLLVGFFLGLATGTGVLNAMYFGARDREKLKKLISTAMLLSVMAAVIISVVGVTGCRTLLRWMDTPEDVLPLSTAYLRIIFGGGLITMIYNVGAGMIRAEGDSTRPLIYLVVGGVTNVVLDLLFVAGLGMGVAGAAIATVAAQGVSAVLVVLRLMRLDPAYRLRPLHLRYDRVTAADVIRMSLPCGLQGCLVYIAHILVQAKINSFGTVAMAGVAAYGKIDGFIYMPILALSLACSTYVGQNIGAEKYDRLRRGIRICLAMAVGVSMLSGGTILLTCRRLMRLFTDDPAAAEYGLKMMRFVAPLAWIFTFSDILGGAVRGAGEAGKVTLISALCTCAFRVLWLFVMLHFFHDIRIVFACYPLSWILSTTVMALFYFRRSRIMCTLREHGLA